MRDAYVEKIKAHPGIDDSLIEFCQSTGKRYLYGNGPQAATCLGFFREMEVPIHGILTLPGYDVPRLKGYWGRMLNSVPAVFITELFSEEIGEAAVLIASPRESHADARVFLERVGFRHIYTCTWNRNQYIRDICMDVSEMNQLSQ